MPHCGWPTGVPTVPHCDGCAGELVGAGALGRGCGLALASRRSRGEVWAKAGAIRSADAKRAPSQTRLFIIDSAIAVS